MAKHVWVVVGGPTGVGKTAFADALALAIDGEIVNGDLGQMYVPLTIGTAKPAWQNAVIPHHLFDILDTPVLFSAMSFRKKVKAVCKNIWQRKKIPIIVGGSSYYIASLFFPPAPQSTVIRKRTYDSGQDICQTLYLYTIDPQRAQSINPHDRYRIERALDIWYSTGIKPSEYKPQYYPIAPSYFFIWLERDRQDLYDRINKRVEQMVAAGWIAEVQQLLSTA
jgi:tRNA dimethylallyltransferase